MRLLGFEFVNFACFDRQFVPLRPGITLLVGRNNAGKTAILRALSTLEALPVNQPKTVTAPIAGYYRQTGFDFDLLYQMEESDASRFDLDAPVKNTVAAEGVRRALTEQLRRGEIFDRWRFRVIPSNYVVFLERRFELDHSTSDGKREAIIYANQNGQLFHHRVTYPSLNEAGVTNVRSVTLFEAPDRARYPVFGTDEMSAPLRAFGAVKLIDPHRVVRNRQALQTTQVLPSDAQTLGPYLQTLQGNNREAFEQIEHFVTKVFPEFRFLNAANSENSQVVISLEERSTRRKIPLENCGTGVEQILTLATFILTTPKPGLVLLDEPHSYLHPTAERALVELLHEHPENYYALSTHSAVLMNSVPSDRILHITPPGQGYEPRPNQASVSRILFDLGYRNSDSLFYDRLIFVEGKSDRALIRHLLQKQGEISAAKIDRTGFPALEGASKGLTALQMSIHRHEKLLSAIAGREQPRIYIVDGDRTDNDKSALGRTKNPATLKELPIKFLPRLEIENYLLVPEAIATAIREELDLKEESTEISIDAVRNYLAGLLASDETVLFPQSKGGKGDPMKEAKGSVVLERLYDHFSLPYNKEHSGLLIAKHITKQNQPAIAELTELVRPIFEII